MDRTIQVTREPTLSWKWPGAEFPTQESTAEAVIFHGCYLRLLLWGPLLAVTAYAYHQRRRRQERLRH